MPNSSFLAPRRVRSLHRQVAAACGESVRLVRRLGFQLASSASPEPEDDRAPLVVDWDEVDGRFAVGGQRLPRGV